MQKKTLKRWFRQNATLPIGAVALGLLLLEGFLFAGLLWQQRGNEFTISHQLAELARVSLVQKNGALLSSGLEIARKQLRAKEAFVCEKRPQYVRVDLLPTECPISSHWAYRILEIPIDLPEEASGRYSFLLQIPRFPDGSFVAYSVALSLLICFFAIFMLTQMNLALKRDVLSPLVKGIDENSELAILELEEIRRHVLEVQEVKSREAAARAVIRSNAQVAHDIRSPLMALTVALGELSTTASPVLDLIRGATERIQKIADCLMDENRNWVQAPASVAVRSLVEELINEKKYEFKNRAEIFLESDASNPRLPIEAMDMKRIISNLINNAVEAGGEKRTPVQVSSFVKEGRWILKVVDQGCGFDEGTLKNIGSWGNTSKKGIGTGMGLAHAKSTLERWGGQLDVNRTGGQTAVSISLRMNS